MICSGKQIEIEGFDLLSRGGLISRCIYINDILVEAKMNETNLDSDPLFTQNGRAILLFTDKKGNLVRSKITEAKFHHHFVQKLSTYLYNVNKIYRKSMIP